MIAHQCHHDARGLILARQFWSYWGHAARLDLHTKRPIRAALHIYGVQWALRAEGVFRRQVGYWPHSARFLQLAWDKIKQPHQPLEWVEAARDMQLWKDSFCTWAVARHLPTQGQLDDVMSVDLLGRQVLQVGRQFMLLPMRHVPVEEAYDAPFRIVQVADDEHAASVVQL